MPNNYARSSVLQVALWDWTDFTSERLGELKLEVGESVSLALL